VLLCVVLALTGLLIFRSRNEPLEPEEKPTAVKTRPWKPEGQEVARSLPASASQPGEDGGIPELEPLELPKPPRSHVPLELTPDGRWVPLKRVGARHWTEFQSVPPRYFVSEEEQRRFREYWVKEAHTRVSIYCEVTDICPPADEVGRLIDSLFDDILPQREDEPTDAYRERLQRWMRTRWRWIELFGDTPQSVFSFAGLEQFRGKEQPKPPLEPEQLDAGPEIRRPDDPKARYRDAGSAPLADGGQ